MSLRTFGLTALTAALLTVGAASHAVTISASTNNPYNFSWNQAGGTSGSLKGTGSLTISGFNSTQLSITVTLNNTSTVASDRLTSFGFGIDPNATGVNFSDANDGGMINAGLVSQLTGNLKAVEICSWGGPNCSGGGNGGINGGGSDTFTLLLAGNWGASVNIDPIGFKYQTNVGSYEFTTSSGVTTSGKTPEPHSTALVGMGLLALGLGFVRRRKQAATSAA